MIGGLYHDTTLVNEAGHHNAPLVNNAGRWNNAPLDMMQEDVIRYPLALIQKDVH